tara:strand:+ start:499 stop:669 length:171 start_codon:yes stop_codon:yes gene_type:complete
MSNTQHTIQLEIPEEKINNLNYLTTQLNNVKMDVLKIIAKENNIDLNKLKKEFSVD